jgi:Domain of unknown function (DUF4124)
MLPSHFHAALNAAVTAAALALSTGAWSDVYKWTDERGNTVISNSRPKQVDSVRNFEVAVEEPKGSTRGTVPPTPTEQLLLHKIEGLERELQAQRAPPANYASYTPAPPPPPSVGYYGSDYAGFYSPYFGSYPYVAYPSRRVVIRPHSAAGFHGFGHTTVSRGGFAHRGRR